MEYETRIVSVLIVGKGGDIFDEGAMKVSIDDEGAGEFVVLEQNCSDGVRKLLIDPGEWPLIVEAVGGLLKDIARRENPVEAAQLDALRAEMKRDEEPLV